MLIGTNFPTTAEYSPTIQKLTRRGLDPAEMIAAAGLAYVELALHHDQVDRASLETDIEHWLAAGVQINMHPYYRCAGFGTNSENRHLRPSMQTVLTVAGQVAQQQGRAVVLNFHAASGGGHIPRATLLAQSNAFNQWLVETADTLNADVIITTEHQLPTKPSSTWQRFGDTYDELLAMMFEHPKFGTCWDMGHSAMGHVLRGADLLPPHAFPATVKHIHCHDVDFAAAKDHRRIGTGDSPLGDYLRLLPGYDGCLTMEYSADEFFGDDYTAFLLASKDALLSLLHPV